MEARVALITGAGSGLGRELAIALARSGVAIAAIDRDAVGVTTLAEELWRDHRPFAWAVADVTDAEVLAAKTALLEEKLGPIDLVIANAGIGKDTPAHDFQAADVAKLVNVNLLGVANTIAAILPGMIERRRGHIVGISSLASLHGLPRMGGYCASKAGVNALLESLHLGVQPYGIAVTTVCPGYMRTPMNAMMDQGGLLDVQIAVEQILTAIQRRRRFCAFPRWQALGLRMLQFLPHRLADWCLLRSLPPATETAPVPVIEAARVAIEAPVTATRE